LEILEFLLKTIRVVVYHSSFVENDTYYNLPEALDFEEFYNFIIFNKWEKEFEYILSSKDITKKKTISF